MLKEYRIGADAGWISFVLLWLCLISFPAFSESPSDPSDTNSDMLESVLEPSSDPLQDFLGEDEDPVQINKIHVEALDVFDPKIPQYRRWFFRAANKLHIKTQDSFVRRDLLFQEGDFIDQDLLEETERNLRKRKFLDNVDIQTVPVGENKVDLFVHTEDQWTTQVDISASTSSGYQTIQFGIEESNFLGLGKTLGVEYQSNPERNRYQFLYYDPQFLNSRWNFEVGYETASDGWRYTTDMIRPFYSMDTKWAYGASWDSGAVTDKFYHKGRAVAEIDAHHRNGLLFAARSWGERYDKKKFGMLFSMDSLLYPNPARIVFADAASVKAIRQNLQPIDQEGFQYGAMTKFEKQHWIEQSYLDNFGRIEDLPTGLQFGGMVGYSEGINTQPDYLRFYSFAEYGWDKNLQQYLSLQAQFSTRKDIDGGFNNYLFTGYARYYYKLSPLKVGKMTFPQQTLAANVTATLTKDINAPFQISLGENEGLRGYTFKSFTGQNSLLLNVEDRIFTPFNYRVLGIGLAAFMDAGYVWSSDENLTFNDFGLSVGIGLRIAIKKSQSARVVRVDFAIPLHKETGAFTSSAQRGYSISVSTGQIFPILGKLPKLFQLF